MPSELECEVFADVDFGNGRVEVRCTETGPHRNHICHVDLTRSDPQDTNLFEENANV